MGVHGTPEGLVDPHLDFLHEDIVRYGDYPGVHVCDISVMSAEQVLNVVTSPGTVIGGFCHSESVLRNMLSSVI